MAKNKNNTTFHDEHFMNIALQEAAKANHQVYPNPKVGALIVINDKIISRGYHKAYGEDHAEANAIKKLDRPITNATLYVTLEPCAHFGKKNPCTDIIKSEMFNRVVIGTMDPNPKASGGAEILRKNNIEVVENICSNEARKLNKRFFTFFEKKRPYIILKIATTLDGFIAEQNGLSKWITNEKSRESVHKLRSTCDAILVGSNTIKKDDPSLTSHGYGKDPKIIVFGSQNEINNKYKISKANPIFFAGKKLGNNYKKNITYLLNDLYKKSYQSLLVEGGGKTFSSFLDSDLFDELNIYYAPKFIGSGISLFTGNNTLTKDYKLQLHKVEHFDNDVKMTFYKGI
tara:strand:+ start:120 stop:1151 length:1032 start_codon:yes stop_codon:yes gene_type:complete